jgi:hypothetical protein
LSVSLCVFRAASAADLYDGPLQGIAVMLFVYAWRL